MQNLELLNLDELISRGRDTNSGGHQTEAARLLLLQKGERGHGAFTVWLDAIARERHTSARTLRRWMREYKMAKYESVRL